MNFLEPNIKRSLKKSRRGKNRGDASNANKLVEGNYGLMAASRGELKPNQYEAARKAFVQLIRQRLKLITRFSMNTSRTAKPLESRMGKGKGDIDYWVFKVQPGRVIFEAKIFNKPAEEVIRALKASGYKLPFKVKVLRRI